MNEQVKVVVDNIEMNNQATAHSNKTKDIESAGGAGMNKDFDWDDSDNEEEEHNKLLTEFRAKNFGEGKNQDKGTATSLQHNEELHPESGQPLFHHRQRGFLEKVCRCCVEPCDLTRREVSMKR
jgi:hypothetical protein